MKFSKKIIFKALSRPARIIGITSVWFGSLLSTNKAEAGVSGGGGSSPGGGGGTGGGGCDNALSGSTPYLYTWNGERFQIENDFMIGEPTTFRFDPIEAKKAYETGEMGPDLYCIRNPHILKDGKLVFRIKEIEAEESYIDHLSLRRVVYPKNSELIVDSHHSSFHVYTHKSLTSREGITQQNILVKGKEAPEILGDLKQLTTGSVGKGVMLEKGDIIEVQGKVENTQSSLYLLMGSWYRDWTPGRVNLIQSAQKIVSPISRGMQVFLPKRLTQTLGLLLLVSLVSVSGFISRAVRGTSEGNSNDNARTIPSQFGLPVAHASDTTTCSTLIESYWDWDKEAFHLAKIIHPRQHKYSIDAISLPKKAISKTGEVRVRITATKRHHVNVISLFAPSSEGLEYSEEKLSAKSAVRDRDQKDYANEVNTKNNTKYLHIIPGDVVDVEFELPQKEIQQGEQEAYLLHATGFYTSLSKEGRHTAGNWTDGLDLEERMILSDMYPLEEYQKENRTPALV